ncbi:hypothetical protein I7I48_03117 [Histoplasma ohiense]|nr:hypothetical protein I7I48_03117 [Histoplasma ohiense (nom. inval.)]
MRAWIVERLVVKRTAGSSAWTYRHHRLSVSSDNVMGATRRDRMSTHIKAHNQAGSVVETVADHISYDSRNEPSCRTGKSECIISKKASTSGSRMAPSLCLRSCEREIQSLGTFLNSLLSRRSLPLPICGPLDVPDVLGWSAALWPNIVNSKLT